MIISLKAHNSSNVSYAKIASPVNSSNTNCPRVRFLSTIYNVTAQSYSSRYLRFH